MAPNSDEFDIRAAQFRQLGQRAQSAANSLGGMVQQSGSAIIGMLAYNKILSQQTRSMQFNLQATAQELLGKRRKLAQMGQDHTLSARELTLKRKLQSEIQGLIEDMQEQRDQIKEAKFNQKMNLLEMVGQAFKEFADGLRNFVNQIYKTQQDVGVGFAAGVLIERDARIASIISKIPGVSGPILETEELVNTYSAFTKEFGTILAGPEAARMAETAKRAGVSADILVKAQRSFISAGGNLSNLQSVYANQFIKAGLTEAQALKFAADNANLVAIAGVKYADSLARAAANATKIGVSLEKTSGFFDGIVDDFEGSLERSVELSALGFNIDFNQIARIGGMGTDEERQAALVDMFKQNRSLLEDVQRNAFLRRAIEKDTGFDITEAMRMARGEEAQPEVETINELQLAQLKRIGDILEQTSKAASIGSKLLNVGIEAAKGAAIGTVAGGGPWGTAIGAIAMGGKAAMTEFGAGRAMGGLITGPGTSTSDNILTPTSPGEFVINARATQAYGVDFLDSINRGQFNQNVQQPQPVNNVINIDMTEVKNEIKNLAQQMRGMAINVDGNQLGEVVFNSGTPINRVSAY